MDNSGLWIGHTTDIHKLMELLDSGAAISHVLSLALAGLGAHSSEGPSQAYRLVVKLGDFTGMVS